MDVITTHFQKKGPYLILTLVMFFSAVIWAFPNVGLDEQYQIALAYRLLRGDQMIIEMLEPHQFSAFLCAGLMWLYERISGSFTGIALFLHVIGLLLRGVVTYLFYRFLKKRSGAPVALVAATLFFMIVPKDQSTPEYSNLQTWLCALCFMLLVSYFENNKKGRLFFLSVTLFAAITTYFSCVLVYVAILILMAFFSEKKARVSGMLVPTGVCAALGGLVIAYFLGKRGYDEILAAIQNMLSVEPSHATGFADKYLGYLRSVGSIALLYLGIAAVCLLLTKIGLNFVISFYAILLIRFLYNILTVGERCEYVIIFFFMIILGLVLGKHLRVQERILYVCGTTISLAEFVSTLILTNLPLAVSGAYTVLAISLSVIPVWRYAETKKAPSFQKALMICWYAFILLLFLRCVYIRTPMVGRAQICSTFNTDLSLIHTGPGKWLITDDAGARKQQSGYQEFRELVPDGSAIWITGGLVHDLGYLYGDYDVAAPTIIPDPKFVSGMGDYWKRNPDKMPDVVIINSYDGVIDVEPANSQWFTDWLENDFDYTRRIDGEFYTYFFRE